MSVGTIVRYDDVRGYGFITPSGGGDDVFVHANDFGEKKHLVRVGSRVAFEVAEGDRGPKVASVTMLDPPGVEVPDFAICDVLSEVDFRAELSDLLIREVPTLTGGQIGQIRGCLIRTMRRHGWIDS